MTRGEFIKMCGLLGISLPFHSIITSCSKDEDDGPSSSSGSVLILGAGAAGMTAAYLLKRKGIDFQILEASSTYGGRMKQTTSFTDFPIPLGAEWLHGAHSNLDAIVDDSSVNVSTQTIGYNGSDPVGIYQNGMLTMDTVSNYIGSNFADRKFINSTWFDFFETYVYPSISGKITYNTPIVSINSEGSKVVLKDNSGQTYQADRVIVTVPIKILQDGDISFTPPLSQAKQAALSQAKIWSGFKAFFKFSQNFYPAYLLFPEDDNADGDRAYYDAAYGQTTNDNIMGVFAVGKPAEAFQALSDTAFKDHILNDLDTIFNGQATPNYIDHITQNWNEEPYIKAAYLSDEASYQIPITMAQSIGNKVFFAGDTYTDGSSWGEVHTAARSARNLVSSW